MHRRVRHGHVFQINRADPFTARLDHIFTAIRNLHEALSVDLGHVAGGKPFLAILVCGKRLCTFTAEVTVDHPMPAHQQVAESLAIPRQFFAIVTDNFHIHPENCSALLLHDVLLFFQRQIQVLCFQTAYCAQGRKFSHAPGMNNLNTQTVQRFNHCCRRCRAANYSAIEVTKLQAILLHMVQQTQPHGGHASREIHLLAFQQFVNGSTIQSATRHHHFCTRHQRNVGNAPSVNMEHGYHGQNRIAAAQAQSIGCAGRHCMQYGGAV